MIASELAIDIVALIKCLDDEVDAYINLSRETNPDRIRLAELIYDKKKKKYLDTVKDILNKYDGQN